MKITFYETTHIGARRNNQDFYAHVIAENWAFFVVADGLGGHQRGEVAAKTFCECLCQQVGKASEVLDTDPMGGMDALILKAHSQMQKEIFQQYGVIDSQTTFALIWINANRLITAHVGDSRVYRINPRGVIWRTPDHTLVQALFEEGRISEADFSTHPLQNRLLKTVNLFEPPMPDIILHERLTENELLILCTDGFWTHLPQATWATLARIEKLEEKINELVFEIAHTHPLDADNITVQALRVYTLPR